MARGVAHSAELRAQVVAAVLAGASVSAVAREHGLSKQSVSRWVNETGGTHQGARDPETIGDLIYDLIVVHLEALSAQLQAVSRPEWLEKQTAADVAQLLGAERDTTIRLLAGLRPIRDDEPPALGAPESPDPTLG